MVLAGFLIGCSKSDLSTPKGAAKTFASALERGDAETAKNACTGADPKVIESMAHMMPNMKKLREAAKSKFGDQGTSILGGSEDMSDLAKKVDDSDVKEQGDTATLTPKNTSGMPMKLKKVGSDWKVDASELSGAMGGAGTGMIDGMSKAASETADEINAGKYKTADEAKQAFGVKAMGGAMGHLTMPDAPK
jgi:hypothetical protein